MSLHRHYFPQNNEISIFSHAAANLLPVSIKGPAGCGKTRFVEYMAEQLDLPLYTISCHKELTADDLIGRLLNGVDGTYWLDGPLTKAVRHGGICYLKDVTEVRESTIVVLHPLSDYRRILLPLVGTGEIINADPDFMLVISYCPGYQGLMSGPNLGTRQRFVALSFDYQQPEYEAVILCQETNIIKEIAQKLVSFGSELRRLKDPRLVDVVSTRLLIYTAIMIESGISPMEACIACIVEPLTDDTKTKEAIIRLIDVYFPE